MQPNKTTRHRTSTSDRRPTATNDNKQALVARRHGAWRRPSLPLSRTRSTRTLLSAHLIMKAFTGATRMAFLIFFVSHIPITLFVDSQALLPASWHPQAVKDLLDMYVDFCQDPLMARPTFAGPWFQSFVVGELLFQLPFFIVAVRMLRNGQSTWPDWFRTACIVYGSHTSTTLIPILATVITYPETTVLHKVMTAAVYAPYAFFPLWLTILAAMDTTTNTKSKSR